MRLQQVNKSNYEVKIPACGLKYVPGDCSNSNKNSIKLNSTKIIIIYD